MPGPLTYTPPPISFLVESRGRIAAHRGCLPVPPKDLPGDLAAFWHKGYLTESHTPTVAKSLAHYPTILKGRPQL